MPIDPAIMMAAVSKVQHGIMADGVATNVHVMVILKYK